MATPLTSDQFLAALKAEGVRVVEVGSWRTHTRTRPEEGRYWGPVNGVVQHHTVTSGEQSSVDLCRKGYSDLPGPLCHGVIGKSGTVYLVGYGRTNHAGGGDPDVLNAVVNENYGATPPAPDVGNTDGVDGNRRFYGFECINMGDGKDPWPEAQVDAMVRASAALCRAHGWGAKSVIGHKEWSDDKSDPRGPGDVVAMPRLRTLIAERLAHPASWNPQAPTEPAPGGDTVPNRSVLQRTENLTLVSGVPQTIYWTTEYPDDANGHGEGGKTVATNVRYDGVIHLRLNGLAAGACVEVYPCEEDENGNVYTSPVVAQVDGRGDGSQPVLRAVPVNGTVGKRLTFQVVSRSSATVVLDETWLNLFHWPNV